MCVLNKILPRFIFEDGYDHAKTVANEKFLLMQQFPLGWASYGYGGTLVSKPAGSPFSRDNVSAVYKLSQSGDRPVMKWSATPGKESVPGKPVVFTRFLDDADPAYIDCAAVIGQVDETPPEGFMFSWSYTNIFRFGTKVSHSPATIQLINACARNVGKPARFEEK